MTQDREDARSRIFDLLDRSRAISRMYCAHFVPCHFGNNNKAQKNLRVGRYQQWFRDGAVFLVFLLMRHRHWNICSGSAGAGTMVGSDMSSDAGTENGAGTTVNFVCFYPMNDLSKKCKHK